MLNYRVKSLRIEAIQYTNYYSDEIKAFLGGIPNRFDNAKGIFVATLEGVVLVTSGMWLVKCPSVEENILFYTDEEFQKFFEPLNS